jgi:hypothetical protein
MEALDKVFTVFVDCLQPDPVLEEFLKEEYPRDTIRGIMVWYFKHLFKICIKQNSISAHQSIILTL